VDESIPAKVMQETLDKFVSLVGQQNKAYSSMGSAVEAVSDTVVELTNRITSLEKQIADEQLAVVLTESLEAFQVSVTNIRENMGKIALPENEYKDLLWGLGAIRFVRKRFVLLVFTSGVLITWITIRAGVDITGFLKTLLQGFAR
jgi:hypothetical protein